MSLIKLFDKNYSVFHQLRPAKFAYGGLILGSRQVFTDTPAASKIGARFKCGQN
jgi:hypothetical protein